MALVTTKEMFKRAYEGGYSIGAFNVDNLETFQAVIEAAHAKKSPVIIAITENVIKYFGITYLRKIVEAAVEDTGVEVALHLDHGKSIEICKYCCDNGFTSVMIDASAYDFEENIRITKEVVEYAHARGVVVESELGAIAGIEDGEVTGDKYGVFTHPEQAKEFVERTGIDSLAIAIGTAHGAYKFKPGTKPQLRFDILDEIAALMPNFPLVLHGASSVPAEAIELLNKYGGKMEAAIGIPESMLAEACRRGVCKINVGTDIRVAFVGAMRKALHDHPEKFDVREFFTPRKEAITKLIEGKIDGYLGSAGKAVCD